MSNDNPGTVVLVVGGSYSNCVVVLDGFIFFASKFSNCVFIYLGSPIALFADRNVIDGPSKLELSPNVPNDSDIVAVFKAKYPKVLVIPQSNEPLNHR